MKVHGLQIVRATQGDAPELTRIARAAKAHWNYPPEWLAEWQSALTLSVEAIRRHAVFVATVEKDLRGFYLVRDERPDAWLDHLWVLPQWIGGGIGRALFEHAAAMSRTAGCERLLVESDPNAAGFYRRMGCAPVGHRRTSVESKIRDLPLFGFDLTKIALSKG